MLSLSIIQMCFMIRVIQCVNIQRNNKIRKGGKHFFVYKCLYLVMLEHAVDEQ